MFSTTSFALIGDGGGNEGEGHQSDPMDLHSPDPYNLGRYVRLVPVIIYHNGDATLADDKMAIDLREATWLWGTQFTGKKYGVFDSDSDVNALTETFLLIVDGDLNTAALVDKGFRLTYFKAGHQPVYNFRTESSDGYPTIAAKGPVPALEEFHQQKAGVSGAIISEFDLLASFEKTQPNTYGEEYIRLVGQGDKPMSSLYSNFDNIKNIKQTYEKSNSLAPYYDKWQPKYDQEGNVTNREEAFAPDKSFYRGSKWSSKLGIAGDNKATLEVPGQVVAIFENVDLIATTIGEYVNLEPGTTANVKIKVTNYSEFPVQGTNLRWCENDNKYNWKSVAEDINLDPWESKECSISVPVKEVPYSIIAKVNQEEDAPAIETDYDNNVATAMIIPKIPEPPPPAEAGPSTGNLILQAVSQTGSQVRPQGQAKWTDWVTATLKPNTPTPPRPSGTIRNLRVTSWNITSATLTYPKKHPDFTFGDPLPPLGTVSANMSSHGHTATLKFQENWAMDGAKIYNIIRDELMAPNPKNYPIKCQYGISFKYAWESYEIVGYTAEGSPIYEWVPRSASASTSGNASANLLVTGTGVNSRAQ